jgi:hypothetical protein
VDLNAQTGTYVTGKYFVALQNNRNASVSFTQDGVEIIFAGKDIKKPSELDLFNFAYANKAPHEADILSNVDAGNESFTFGFAHHGELPGTANFTITTNMTQGTKVNVYKYLRIQKMPLEPGETLAAVYISESIVCLYRPFFRFSACFFLQSE